MRAGDQQSFAKWNRDIVSLFEEQVRQAPEATALVDGEATLSYRELNERANRLARHLVSLGVAPRSFVGICLERSFDSVVGVLAILKAGATYVPIDHQYPQERIRFILRDSAVPWTLAASTLPPSVLSTLQSPVLVDEASLTAAYDPSNLGVDIAPSFSAYVMYTSGTSGEPKGVAIPQSGISRLVRHANYIDLDSTDVILHHSTCAFDAATFEIWAALLNGGTLVIHRPKLDLDALGGLIRHYGVTTLLLTTSVFHLVAEHKPDSLAPLRQVVTGGDVMQAKAVKKVLALHPHLKLVNGYGPTENTTFTCCFVITRETKLADTVPIGKPISGTNVFILDKELRPVQVGEVGQLYTNGLGMGTCYLNREELTRSHFVTSPFPEQGPLLYRTGDLVREDADGNIHFIGRADGQVKIRGYRVEPGEVEHALNLRPDVADSVVLAEVAASSGEKQLVAYVKRADPASTLDARELKRDLSTRLPHYMVPARIHLMDHFPLTHNGKIDKERLRKRVETAEPEPVDAGLPETHFGQVVLDVWRRQLGAPALREDTSVYDHGASSLTLMVVQSELNQRLRCSVEPTSLAMAQTPREWADIYERYRASVHEA
ncbi:non-ribosomal peptide synthetase [Archangium violaceum]|uniref:non-ribosomal peptide synthetase n=1 Tax=Archangium violaceum TaxID=83451 RepID=UPI002B31060E|nr:non-ribosomal peptide synthetase [Archangium violaceum]